MNSHTLILSTAKLPIPEDISIYFVTKLLHRGLTLVEYFGIELDNPLDFLDDDMKAASEEITYIDFNFDTPESIDYDSLTIEEIEHLIDDIIKNSKSIEIRADEKDVTLYL